MNKTKIEYMDFSWNPIAMRCTPVSAGCANCWHLGMADRLAGNGNFHFDVRRAYAGEGPPVLMPERLMKPARRKKPARIGVQFMGDLFHDKVVDSFIEAVFDIMIGSPQHSFQILTKRPERMRHFIQIHFPGLTHAKHIWLGITIENQKVADERIPLLLRTPAKIRFVSCEPLLASIDLLPWLRPYPDCGNVAEDGTCASLLNPTPECHVRICPMTDIHQGISWVIVGGESGSRARPMHPQWARDIRDQCLASATPFFFKQLGEWAPYPSENGLGPTPPNGCGLHWFDPEGVGAPDMWCIGKKRAGRLLDGKEWNELPQAP